ncbi:MAG: RNA polymerase sigma factor RpoD/SigA [Ginsengibacter sp.]
MSMRSLKISKSITNRESESLEKYLQEIGRVEMISPEEEVELGKRIKTGDQDAINKLTKANLRFVVSVAKQYQNQGLSLPDLINEGNVGLIKAAQRFDETRGFKFISYGVWWIRQSILQALAEQSRIVRLPINKVGLSNRISRAYSQLEQEYERTPTTEELASLLHIESEEVSATMGVAARHLSMDSPLSDGEESTLIDVLVNGNADSADKRILFDDSLRKEIQRSLTLLTPRQKEVICYFYGINVDESVSLEDLGIKYGLTRERVRQIKDKALEKLKTFTGSNLLKEYLGA